MFTNGIGELSNGNSNNDKAKAVDKIHKRNFSQRTNLGRFQQHQANGQSSQSQNKQGPHHVNKMPVFAENTPIKFYSWFWLRWIFQLFIFHKDKAGDSKETQHKSNQKQHPVSVLEKKDDKKSQ